MTQPSLPAIIGIAAATGLIFAGGAGVAKNAAQKIVPTAKQEKVVQEGQKTHTRSQQARRSYDQIIVSPFGARERNFESGRR